MSDSNRIPAEAGSKENTPDPFRDTPVRFFGYANELGEAFKAVAPRAAYLGSYGVALAYVLSDAHHKGSRELEQEDAHPVHAKIDAGKAVVDTAMWQGLASVVIPGFAINRIVSATATLTQRLGTGRVASRVLPPAVGLCAIPLIIKPIDSAVDGFMESVVRPGLSSISAVLKRAHTESDRFVESISHRRSMDES